MNIYGEQEEVVVETKKEKPTKTKKVGDKKTSSSKTSKTNKTSKTISSSSTPSIEQPTKSFDEDKVKKFLSSIVPKPEYIKHIIECRCVLPQYINKENPPNHKFVVFSELDQNALVKEHYSQCNNCGIVHRVTEVGTSYTIKKESMMSMPTIDDIKSTLPEWLRTTLEKNNCTELHTWQEAQFIFHNEMWGRFVVLVKERDRDNVSGKILQILGKELHKIEFFERDDSDAKQ